MHGSMEFEDVATANSGSTVAIMGHKKKKGCWVGPWAIAGIILLTALLVMIVALMVFYLHPDRKSGGSEETTSAPEPPSDLELRLPPTLEPYHYDLSLRPNIYSNNTADFYFNGSVRAFFTVRNRTNNIILHAKQLNISDDVTVFDQDDQIVASSPYHYDPLTEFLTVPVGRDLEKDRNYSVAIQFRGSISGDLKGLYLSTYTQDGETKHMATSHLQPTDARKVFPCFDEPALKATFSTTMERKENWQSYSNTIIASSDKMLVTAENSEV